MPTRPLRPRNSRAPRIHSVALLLVASLLLAACADRTVGSGVVLWSPDEELIRSGSVVTVVSESDITNTYVVEAEVLGEPLELPRWRVELFESSEEAEAYAAEYAASFDGSTTLYARATRNALPIRTEARASATNTVYRLRENEEIKLIGRSPEQVNLEGLVSFWYEALTRTGERGWVFGYTLEVYDPTDPSVVVQRGGSDDPLVDLLVQNVWRPIYFLDMISNGAIDLELFRPEYGLFPDPENRQLELVLPYHSTIFEYESITRVGPRRYLAEGTSLQLTFQRNDELSIQYRLNDQQYILALQRVPGGVQEYIDRETERRDEIYRELLETGPTYTSDNYGTLRLREDRRFEWIGYDRLVPTAVPAGARTTGRIDLGLFLSANLMQQFDGALSFIFDGATQPVSFAYTYRGDAVRLVWIQQADIDDRVVLRTAVSPLTIFMSSTGE